MMDRTGRQSVSVARALVEALPRLIAQAEAGKLTVSAMMLRLALEDASKFVGQAETRCGRVIPENEFQNDRGM